MSYNKNLTQKLVKKLIQKKLKIPEDDIFFISAATGEGTQKLLQSLEEVISQSKLDLT